MSDRFSRQLLCRFDDIAEETSIFQQKAAFVPQLA